MTATALAKALPDALSPTAAARRRGNAGRQNALPGTALSAETPTDLNDLANTQDDDLRYERAAEVMRQACRNGSLAEASAAAAAAMPTVEPHAPRVGLLHALVQAQPAAMVAPGENRLYLLHRMNGAPMALLRLRDNGLISASGGSELARWTLADGQIELHGRDGRASSRFALAGERADGQRLYLGESLQDGSLHLLSEVDCTYSRLRMLDPELAGPFCGLYDIDQMVFADLPPQPVVVIATPHTGSQRLLRLLNSHPHSFVDGELLHPQYIGLYGGELRSDEAGALYSLRAKDPMYFSRMMMNRSHHSDGRDLTQVPMRGFTFNPMHSRQTLDWVMDTKPIRVVHLVRDNLLAEYASLVAGGADSPRRPRMQFEPERFERFVDMKQRYLGMLRERLDKRSGAWAEIETSAFNRDNIQALLSFLNGSPSNAPLPVSSLARTRTERPIERFDNPEAVRQCLTRLGAEHWAEGEGPAPGTD